MKHVPFALALVLAVASAPAAAGQEIARARLDDPARLGLTIAADPAVPVDGAPSIRITTKWPVTVCLAEVDGFSAENVVLTGSVKVRTALEGAAAAEMWVQVGGKRYFSRGLNDPARNTSGWKTVSAPFALQKGQVADKATLNLIIDGVGTVWVSGIALSRAAAK